jgi:hypothetical protein
MLRVLAILLALTTLCLGYSAPFGELSPESRPSVESELQQDFVLESARVAPRAVRVFTLREANQFRGLPDNVWPGIFRPPRLA